MTITLTREKAQQVLDALNKAISFKESDTLWSLEFLQSVMRLGNDLRARLSAPEPEPVAWLNKLGNGAWIADVLKCEGDEPSEPLYTAPPQREWQGLTDEEVGMLTVFDGLHHVEIPLLAKFARAIESKLKGKNT
jgi:hypothetical protein